jgi:hypothetical protein
LYIHATPFVNNVLWRFKIVGALSGAIGCATDFKIDQMINHPVAASQIKVFDSTFEGVDEVLNIKLLGLRHVDEVGEESSRGCLYIPVWRVTTKDYFQACVVTNRPRTNMTLALKFLRFFSLSWFRYFFTSYSTVL